MLAIIGLILVTTGGFLLAFGIVGLGLALFIIGVMALILGLIIGRKGRRSGSVGAGDIDFDLPDIDVD